MKTLGGVLAIAVNLGVVGALPAKTWMSGWLAELGLMDTDQLPLTRRAIADVPSVGDISDMRLLADDDGKPVLLVSGTCGAFEIALDTEQVQSEVKFDLPCPPFLDSRIADVDGDGEVEFIRFETGWTGPTAVLNRDGTVRWIVPNPGRSIGAFDSDGDGRLEVLIGEPNSGNTWLLDHDGKQVWKRTWEGRNFEVSAFDVDGDGVSEFLYTNGDGLQVYDRNGEKRFTTELPVDGRCFENALYIVDEGPELGSARLLVGGHFGRGPQQGQWFYWYEKDAQTVLGRSRRAEAAPFLDVHRIGRPDEQALYVKIVECKVQASVAGFTDSALGVYVFDDERNLIFGERISGRDDENVPAEGSLLVLKASPLRFLVGYAATVWEYTEGDEPR